MLLNESKQYISILKIKIKEEKENKIMGITCKATGKMKGILKRVDNQIESNMKALKEKKSKKNNGNKANK